MIVLIAFATYFLGLASADLVVDFTKRAEPHCLTRDIICLPKRAYRVRNMVLMAIVLTAFITYFVLLMLNRI